MQLLFYFSVCSYDFLNSQHAPIFLHLQGFQFVLSTLLLACFFDNNVPVCMFVHLSFAIFLTDLLEGDFP